MKFPRIKQWKLDTRLDDDIGMPDSHPFVSCPARLPMD
jgi:hypothetical protein